MGMRSISKRIAWLSLLLTLWSALAFAVHHHSTQDESATCQVCVAAHSASPASTPLRPSQYSVASSHSGRKQLLPNNAL